MWQWVSRSQLIYLPLSGTSKTFSHLWRSALCEWHGSSVWESVGLTTLSQITDSHVTDQNANLYIWSMCILLISHHSHCPLSLLYISTRKWGQWTWPNTSTACSVGWYGRIHNWPLEGHTTTHTLYLWFLHKNKNNRKIGSTIYTKV